MGRVRRPGLEGELSVRPSTLNQTPQSVPKRVFLSTTSSTHLNFPFFGVGVCSLHLYLYHIQTFLQEGNIEF